MTIRYAASTRGFYADWHKQVPQDAVEITGALHAELLEAQAKGARITARADGWPEAIFPAPPPAAEQLAAARQAALVALAVRLTDLTGRFTDGLPLAEVASWPTKAEAATRHLAGEPQPMIAAEAAITGEDPEALARAIVARAAQYTGLIARMTGLRRQTSAALEAAPTAEAIAEVLAAALDQAEALLAAASA